MANRLRMLDLAARSLRAIRPPEMKDDPVSFRSSCSYIFRFLRSAVQDLYPARSNFHSVIMIELVPRLQWHVGPANCFGDEIFNLHQQCLWIGRFIYQTFENQMPLSSKSRDKLMLPVRPAPRSFQRLDVRSNGWVEQSTVLL